jgi:8-oxo-dGTP diphosphatase
MEKNPTLLFVVAAALINQADEILIQLRPAGKALAGLWEFPGGKVERGEPPKAALVRELYEELGINVDPADLLPLTFANETMPSGGALGGAGADPDLLLLLFVCRNWTGDPRPIECPDMQWVSIDRMRQLPMPPADKPFIEHLEKLIQI